MAQNNRLFLNLVFLFAVSFSLPTYAQDPTNLPGSIPLEFVRNPAKDLVYQGQRISSDKVTDLVRTQQLDPADLNPVPENPITQFDINSLGQPYNPELDEVEVFNDETVEYIETVDSAQGTFRFQVSKKLPNGYTEDFIVFFGTTAHNTLLRKNLLRKLGYKVPAMKYLPQLRLKVPGQFSRNTLIDNIDFQIRDKKPWDWIQNLHSTQKVDVYTTAEGEEVPVDLEIEDTKAEYSYTSNGEKIVVDAKDVQKVTKYYFLPEGVSNQQDRAEGLQIEDNETTTLVFQDVIVLRADSGEIYNFATGGELDIQAISGRRAMNSLLIPLAMTDLPESINMHPWVCANERNRQVSMGYSDIDIFDNPFSPTHADARWMVRRIAKLSEADFDEVAAFSGYPDPVARLVAEKLKSCRNNLVDIFEVNKAFYFKGSKYKSKSLSRKAKVKKKLKVKNKISFGARLQKGKLLVDQWLGHANNYAHGDPDNPISSSEIFHFFKSQVISNAIANAVIQFNDSLPSGPNAQARFAQNLQKKAFNAFIESLRTGKEEKVGFGIFSEEIYSGSVIASRDVVAGSFRGTDNDNSVQIVDRIGISGKAGLFLGFEGLPDDYFGVGEASVSYTRTYDHIRPLNSIKQANDEPFKNILVPWTKKRLAKQLSDGLSTFDYADEPNLEFLNDLDFAVGEFKKTMLVGESIIITDTINGVLAILPTYSLAERLNIQAQLDAQNRLVLSRIHITRVSKDVFHIYKDKGNVFSVGIAAGINYSRVPLIRLSYRFNNGHAKSEFFKAHIRKPDRELIGSEFFDESYESYVEDTASLRDVLLNGSVNGFRDKAKPFKIDLSFDQSEKEFWFIFNQRLKIKSKNFLDVTQPDGQMRSYIYHTDGLRKGKNFQKLAVDILDSLVSELLDGSDISISSTTNNIPGDTFYGSSLHRNARFEGEIREDAPDLVVDKFANINYRWKGWSATKEEVFEILDSMKEKFGTQFFRPLAFNDTEKIYLYTLDANIRIYEYGIQNLSQLTPIEFESLFARYFNKNNMDFKVFRKPTCMSAQKARGRDCETLYEDVYKDFFKLQRQYLESVHTRNETGISKYGLRMVSFFESAFTIDALLEVLGERNVYIEAGLKGFRIGDEATEAQPILNSNTIGRVGSNKQVGPLRTLQRDKVKMSDSEFYGYWIRRRL